MNYLTTKQVSELWGISPRRIVLLAGQGRIAGAKQMDGRWFIPENAVKPADPRRKNECSADSRYIFPYPLSVVTSEEQINSFTDEEKELYQMGALYERGSFSESRALGEALLSSANPYIRIGALYLLSTVCVYLSDFQAAENYFFLFHTACNKIKAHRAEINILRTEREGEMISCSEYAGNMETLDINAYPRELMPTISACKLFALITKFEIEGTEPDVFAYEILCRMIESQGCFYSAMMMHSYLSTYYALVRDADAEYRHMKRAFEIGLKHDVIFTVSYMLFYNPAMMDAVLREYPDAIRERVTRLAEIFVESRNAYAKYRGMNSILAQLSDDDYKLISCCLKEYSIEQMAKCFELTRSGINKRLAGLYRKFGVKSKNELTEAYLRSLLDFGRV